MSKQQNISFEIVTITPAMAREWLCHNKHNRTIDSRRVAMYAADMKNGHWQTNGESIVFFDDGDLKDGQHRLSAIVKANVPVTMTVIRGVGKENTIHDRGRIRSTANVLELAGYDRKSLVSYAIGTVKYLYLRLSKSKTPISDSQVESFILKHNDDMKILFPAFIKGHANSICRKAPVLAAGFIAWYGGADVEALSKFFYVVNTGLSSSAEETSAVILRNFIINPVKYDVNAKVYGEYTKDRIFEVALQAITSFMLKQPRTKMYNSRAITEYEKNAQVLIEDFEG